VRVKIRPAALLGSLLLCLTLTAPSPSGATTGVPSKQQWLRDVHTAMTKSGARAYLLRRAASGQKRLALNLDIDNTVNETHFRGRAIPEMLAFTRLAHRHGVAVLFNTGRRTRLRTATLALLRRDGFRVDGLCMRRAGEGLVHSKKRCRRQYAAQGWRLIENIGNNPTDLRGHGYERGVLLPNYGGRLG